MLLQILTVGIRGARSGFQGDDRKGPHHKVARGSPGAPRRICNPEIIFLEVIGTGNGFPGEFFFLNERSRAKRSKDLFLLDSEGEESTPITLPLPPKHAAGTL